MFVQIRYSNTLLKRPLLCKMNFTNGFMQASFDKMEEIGNGTEPFFPATFNPSRRADYCVHRNTASCVLSISKVFSDAEQLALPGAEKHSPKSRFCVD